ncbi:SDR family NAD(P)-dependent oxidoreductase [Paenibacillus sp. GCM10012307]|uniref:SDR family NAD(P)-dependent oxidoreductase n=1 Tax=Paenibacillus roseus TaxID=2798579 RepID=A0A934MLZ5_9BACL|nr:SDR family NAD(P)-dependent oxidoreductase [Paenibacillus roseus]MBJ6362755.1 SDR family NAD(P)-dependent oxidoreductase [Paenibacillus roseus]
MTGIKTVMVSGTDRGIGLELVKQLLQGDYTVFAGGIAPDEAALGQLSNQYPGRLHGFRLDVSSDNSVKEAANRIAGVTDRLDLLINNAAILGDIDATIEDSLDFEEIQRIYNITALGAIRLSNALIGPIMNGGKLIVNITSEAGSIGLSHRESWFGYSMAKAALNMGSTIIHRKISKKGGRVLLLHPGWVKSFMRGKWDNGGIYSPEEAASNLLNQIAQHKDEIRDLPLYIEADTGKELPW